MPSEKESLSTKRTTNHNNTQTEFEKLEELLALVLLETVKSLDSINKRLTKLERKVFR